MNIFRLSLIVIILGVILFFLLRMTPSGNDPWSGNQASTVQLKTQHITDASASIKYKIDVSYPEVTGIPNQETQTTINTLIKSKINKGIEAFKNEVTVTEQGLSEAQGLPHEILEAINEYYITYKLSQANEKLISFYYTVMDYQAGENHPNSYNQVFNYDVLSQKELQLSDIFMPNSDYLQLLSRISRAQLEKRFSDNPYAPQFINDGTSPDAKNFSSFNLGANELILIFDPYQVAPYYAGTQVVKIPYDELRDIISPSFFK